jgi:catechol 2,3-dioxygenase-like lactoylglutathione lyase family enzyme
MKRLHVHVAVDDLDRSIGFYSTMFGTKPGVVHPDYAKWMLDDPRVNFAISARGRAPGLDHLGIQVDNRAELDGLVDALRSAEQTVIAQEDAACCYAKSDKGWAVDPSGLRWESFYTHGAITDYGGAHPDEVFGQMKPMPANACCGPAKSCG